MVKRGLFLDTQQPRQYDYTLMKQTNGQENLVTLQRKGRIVRMHLQVREKE